MDRAMNRVFIAIGTLLLSCAPLLAAAGPRYIVVLRPGGKLTDAEVAQLGGAVEERYADHLVAVLPSADALRGEAGVKYVQPIGGSREAMPSPEDRRVESMPRSALQSPPTWSSGTYQYDAGGNIYAIGSDAYAYDLDSRLVSYTRAGATSPTETYDYDPYGNMTSYKRFDATSAAPIAVDAGTNHLTYDTYDHGNDVQFNASSPQTLAYDSLNMMTEKSGSSSGTAMYVYTANDERIGVLTGDTWTWSLRGFDHEVLRQFQSVNSVPTSPWIWLEDYVYRGGQLLGAERVAEEGGRRQFHLDHLGTARLVTGTNGAVESQHDYAPFGAEMTTANQDLVAGFDREEPKRFTGHERDYPGDTDGTFDYMHARSYAGGVGRFLAVDPEINSKEAIHKPQKWNRYSYVLNNPILYHDPTGKQEAAGFSMDRDVQDLLAHLITEQEYWARLNARGMGAAIGAMPWASWWAVQDVLPGVLEFLGDAASSIAARLGTGPGAEIARRVLSDPNRLNHIFGDEGHRLSELTERLGGEANVVSAVADRLGSLGAPNLPTNANGVFNTYIMVGGEVVQVSGRVIDGAIYVSNFWVPRV